MKVIKSHKELIVYQSAFKSSMEIFRHTKLFPKEEIYSLTSQIRGSSRSVSANIAEAEAAETQVWLDYSMECRYLSNEDYLLISKKYEEILGMLVIMMIHPEKWSIKT